MPTMTQQTHDQIGVNKNDIALLNQPRESVELIGRNPRVLMEVEDGGLVAQMQVVDLSSGHPVATMQWDRAQQNFMLVLSDSVSGAVINSLELLHNGTGKLHGSNILTSTKLASAVEIKQLRLNAPFIPAYHYVKEGIPNGGNPIVITSNNGYQDIASLTTLVAEIDEVYEITFSATFNYDSIKRSALFAWSIDGGTTFEEFSIEPKDKTDQKALGYTFPHKVSVKGAIQLVLQAKCENTGDVLTIDYANIIAERKI